jgi:integrase
MDTDTQLLWTTDPSAAYSNWQSTEAAGANRRPFAARSIVQHTAMFERFLRHLALSRTSLAHFGSDHLESFFGDVDNHCSPGTTTRLRYVKLLDRLCRHLHELGVRSSNPVAPFIVAASWPEDDPVPLFLDPAGDAALQGYVQSVAGDDNRLIRNHAIVALFLGSGITAAELRSAVPRDLVVDNVRPCLRVPKRGYRLERTVALPPFSTPALAAWQQLRAASDDGLIFPAPGTTDKTVNDVLLGAIVRDALVAIGFHAPDMSPRVLRNTFARRHLLAGRSNDEVRAFLGLSSQRTVIRLRATIQAATAS